MSPQPLRICMLSYHTCPLASEEGKETGGMNVYVLELSKQLAALGHHVDIFTRCEDAQNEAVVEIALNLRLMHIPAGPSQSLPKKSLIEYIAEYVENVRAFCDQEATGYDVIHSHYYMSGIAALSLQETLGRKHSNVPVVTTFHTLALMKNLVARGDLETETAVRVQAEIQQVKSSKMIIVPSESDAQYLEYLYDAQPTQMAIIPPGVDRTVFHPLKRSEARAHVGVPSGEKIVMFVGRIEPLKGIDMLMYAMKIVHHQLKKREQDMTLRLMIVGGDISQDVSLWSAELQKLEQLRRVLQIPDLVQFVGQKPQHELAQYYNAADIVVMPSHYESFGMAALEAMTCGVPVITTNVAGISSLIDERKQTLLTSVNNPLLLASQIEYLLTHPKTHAQISAEVQSKVTALDWNSVAQSIVETYQSCL